MRILLLDLGTESTQAVNDALSGQGYDIVTDSHPTVDAVRARSAEVLITEATPSDLSCCDIISQLKAVPDARTLRIVMIVHGGALERARALELQADDVISFPFEPLEFAARIRNQFRERQPEVELEAKLHDALQREHLAETAVEALSSGTAATRGRFWLIPASLGLSAVLALAAFATVIANRHSGKETLQLRAEIAQLNGGLLQQGELLRRAEQARTSAAAADSSRARDSLQAQTVQIQKQIAARGDSAGGSLKKQLQDTQGRLSRLENEGRVAETIVHTYGPSVCLLHVVVQFLDRDGQLIRIVLDSTGKPRVDDKGMVSLTTDGAAPPLQLDVFGTGFLVAHDGRLLTNHHVAEPWRTNEDLKPLFDRGAAAFAASYTAYFPGTSQGIAATLDKISPQADLATLKLRTPPPANTALVELDERRNASVTGDPVVLIGYPTGIDGILARAGSDLTRQVAEHAHDVTEIVSQLAAEHLIRPTTTQGHIGDVLTDKIVYDAATTSGGSGGPLFNRDGKVIGVNFAILTGFGGSNLAVPVRYADDLVK
jgi:S1-C subfamily serine protease/DNA-binding NarL/FixJ family response regulator